MQEIGTKILLGIPKDLIRILKVSLQILEVILKELVEFLKDSYKILLLIPIGIL